MPYCKETSLIRDLFYILTTINDRIYYDNPVLPTVLNAQTQRCIIISAKIHKLNETWNVDCFYSRHCWYKLHMCSSVGN